MRQLTLVEAINLALREEMARDSTIVVLGEDVGRSGGVFRATESLQIEFGAERVFDMPVAEAGTVGVAVGMCLSGLRPVVEIQFDSFSWLTLNQVAAHVSRYRWRTHGACSVPMVIRMPYGGGIRAPELHSESPEAYFCHTAGVKVVCPSTPAEARGLLRSALRAPDPVVFLEPKKLYRSLKGEVPDGEGLEPIGQVRTVRQGTTVTLIAWGAMVEEVCLAANVLEAAGISCHVCDLRTLSPLDEEGILAAVRASGRVVVVQEARRSCSVASEVAALIAENALGNLKVPIQRVTGYDVPYPFPMLEHHDRPHPGRIVAAVRKTLGR